VLKIEDNFQKENFQERLLYYQINIIIHLYWLKFHKVPIHYFQNSKKH